MKVTVDRTKWSRGQINRPSYLLNEAGNMCCLGFVCVQLYGRTKEDLHLIDMPSGLHDKEAGILTINHDRNSVFSMGAVSINDRVYDSEDKREHDLTEHFAQNGIELDFIN